LLPDAIVKIFVVVETKKYVTSRTSFSVYNLTVVLAVLYIIRLKDVYYKLLQPQELHVNVSSRMCSNYNSLCCKEFTHI